MAGHEAAACAGTQGRDKGWLGSWEQALAVWCSSPWLFGAQARHAGSCLTLLGARACAPQVGSRTEVMHQMTWEG